MRERGNGNACCGSSPTTGAPPRRRFLQAAIAAGVSLGVVGVANADDEKPGADERPKPGDHFVPLVGDTTKVVTVDDLPLGGPQVQAYPIDPKTGVVRDGSRLNLVILIRLDSAAMNAPMVIDYQKGGATVKGLFTPARNGYLYWLERRDGGGISFVNASPYVKQNVFKSINPETGRPEVDETHKPGTGKKAEFCPSLWGGKDWPYEAYNPKTGMVYIPSDDNHCGSMEGKVQPYVAGQWWTGIAIPDIGFTVDKSAPFYGEVQAWDINNGEQVWQEHYPKSMMWGSLLTTAGDLVFGGGTNDRYFRAYDAKSGKELWQFRTNSGIIAPPSTYEVDGVQYVAVESGYGVDPAFQQGLISNMIGWQKDVPQGGVVWVFALRK